MDSSLPPKLQDLLNQLRQALAQIELEVLAMQRAVPVVSVQQTETSELDLAQADKDLGEWQQAIEKAKADHALITRQNNELIEDNARMEAAVAAGWEQQKQIESEVSMARLKLLRLAEKQHQFELHRQHYEQVVAEGKALATDLAAREQAAKQREEAVSCREHDVSARSERLEATRYWLESLVPSWLNESDVSEWRNALMDDAQHPRSASTTAGLLFATLSLYTFAQRDTDMRAIADALRDLGRRFFAWLKERNVSDAQASNIAQVWAAHINRDCEGRCELEVPVPGAPAQSQTMLYQPRPGVTAQSIVAVQSWCVRGAKREVIHRANVTV